MRCKIAFCIGIFGIILLIIAFIIIINSTISYIKFEKNMKEKRKKDLENKDSWEFISKRLANKMYEF